MSEEWKWSVVSWIAGVVLAVLISEYTKRCRWVFAKIHMIDGRI